MNKENEKKGRNERQLDRQSSVMFHLKNAMSIPPGCRACGNPAYPACKTSCPMFDD